MYAIAALSNSLLLGLPYMNEMQELIFRCHARHKKLPPLNYKDLTAKLTVKSRTGHAAVSLALALQDAVLCSTAAGRAADCCSARTDCCRYHHHRTRSSHSARATAPLGQMENNDMWQEFMLRSVTKFCNSKKSAQQ